MKALVNLAVSALGIGLVTYGATVQGGGGTKAGVSAAFTAAIGALVQQLRSSPVAVKSPQV